MNGVASSQWGDALKAHLTLLSYLFSSTTPSLLLFLLLRVVVVGKCASGLGCHLFRPRRRTETAALAQ